ncbi:non-ribosomal peptide synthetase [Streptomyces sp. NPDC127084]|uniref:non-ribosomal peptide synthetase n=1 Tax=Streptomyces sp. NPDC127084 TaxID=3347133 RepID=UPI00364852AD
MPSITSQYLARYRRATADEGTDLPLPVTGAQRRFVLVRSMDATGRPDLVPMFFAFPRGTVDTVRLASAARRVAALHPVLRARPAVLRGAPVLLPEPPAVPVATVTPALGEDTASALRRALADWAPQGPPMRMFLARDEAPGGEEVLAIVLDHAACDGQSLARVVGELEAAYAEAPHSDEPSPGDIAAELAAYRDAVLLQLEAEDRASSPEAMAHWGERLRGVREQAPPARPGHPAADALPSGTAERCVPAPAAGMSFPGLLDACRAAAAALYGPGHEVPIGYPWGGRPPGAAPVIGCFLNTVVFPATTGEGPGGDSTAFDWWDDLDRADAPFDAVVHAARAAGSGWTGRLDGLLTVDDTQRRPLLSLAGVTGRETHVDGRPVRGPFAVSVTNGPALHLRMVWDRAVLDDDRAEDAFAALADTVAATSAGTAG